MNALVLIGSLIAILTYFPLWKQIRSGEVKQNLLTWVLWGSLDAVASASILSQHGSWFLPVVYTFGSFITVAIIKVRGDRSSWTWFETLVGSLVLVSMAIWYLTSDAMATVASTTALVIASIPQMKDAWQNPKEMPLAVYTSYTVANLLCLVGAKSWTIEERLYPGAATFICILGVLLSLKRFWQGNAVASESA